MNLPGWESLETAKRASGIVQVSTLMCWGILVVCETIGHFWRKRERLLNVMALCAFALAVGGEIVSFEYAGRQNALHEAKEEKIRNDATAQIKKAQSDSEAASSALTKLQKQQEWRQVTKAQRSLLISKLSQFPGNNGYDDLYAERWRGN
jgi:hypothetical protein